VNQSAPKRSYAALVAVVIGMALFMFGAVVIFLFMQPAPAPDVPTGAPTPTFVPTPQFAALVSTLGAEGLGAGKITQANSMALDGAAPIDDVDNIAIDRQDNLFLQDTTKVTRYALTGK
jgi:hypothetical protein